MAQALGRRRSRGNAAPLDRRALPRRQRPHPLGSGRRRRLPLAALDDLPPGRPSSAGGFRKGEKATYVFFAKQVTIREDDGEGGETEKRIQRPPRLRRVQRRPGRRPSREVPRRPARVESGEAYYATLAHEHVHWTGAKQRCDRTFGAAGTDEYAFEELVAELGAAFVAAELGISAEPRPDHASYIASWLRVLREDPKALGQAATLASRRRRLPAGSRGREGSARRVTFPLSTPHHLGRAPRRPFLRLDSAGPHGSRPTAIGTPGHASFRPAEW